MISCTLNILQEFFRAYHVTKGTTIVEAPWVEMFTKGYRGGALLWETMLIAIRAGRPKTPLINASALFGSLPAHWNRVAIPQLRPGGPVLEISERMFKQNCHKPVTKLKRHIVGCKGGRPPVLQLQGLGQVSKLLLKLTGGLLRRIGALSCVDEKGRSLIQKPLVLLLGVLNGEPILWGIQNWGVLNQVRTLPLN